MQVVSDYAGLNAAQEYLLKIKKRTRMPEDTKIHVLAGHFKQAVGAAPPADINIFGMPEKIDIDNFRKVSDKIDTSVLFLRDSKHESASA